MKRHEGRTKEEKRRNEVTGCLRLGCLRLGRATQKNIQTQEKQLGVFDTHYSLRAFSIVHEITQGSPIYTAADTIRALLGVLVFL